MTTKNAVSNCNKHGHNFVESSIGKGPEPVEKVHLFCTRCGEVKVIK